MPTEKELRELAEDLTPYLQTTKNKGGAKPMSDEPMTKTEFQIHELEKALKEANAIAERYRGEVERVIDGHPAPEEAIKHWRDCPECKPKLDAFLQPLTDEAYAKGKADGKKDLTPDDLNINLIGEYFRQRGILGVAKTEAGGEYKPFKSIKTGGK